MRWQNTAVSRIPGFAGFGLTRYAHASVKKSKQIAGRGKSANAHVFGDGSLFDPRHWWTDRRWQCLVATKSGQVFVLVRCEAQRIGRFLVCVRSCQEGCVCVAKGSDRGYVGFIGIDGASLSRSPLSRTERWVSFSFALP